MHTITKNILALMAFALVGTSVATAQTTFPKLKIGDNPRTLNVNAVLELESANKGFLLPRVELEATDLSAPLTEHVEGMTVYNTAQSDATVADDKKVTPGYYYNDGTQWVRIATGADAKTEPWFNQATNTEATENNQSIYQMGSVAIGKDASLTGVALDINGAVRGGTGHLGTVGNNSFAFGYRNTASGNIAAAFGRETIASGAHGTAMGMRTVASGVTSTAMGVGSKAEGTYSTAMGRETNANGNTSTAMGQMTTANGNYSTAMGSQSVANGVVSFVMGASSKAEGSYSVALGLEAIASSYAETAIGHKPAIKTGNPTNWIKSDVLFQLGNSVDYPNPVTYSNALTILKNAHTAIGVSGTEAAAKPTELLDLGGTATAGNGGLKIRNINSPAYTGNVTTDKVVVADAAGVLKTVERSALVPEYVEPWQIIGGTNKATANTDHIYQMGRIAIGTNTIPDITVGASTITPQLHVAGDISTTGKFWTTNSVYADYVFEKYFDGASDINKEYEFKSLDYIKAFISENKHLPGVTKIDDLLKDENGYTFDITKLTVQSLEKIEELYLHTIEQQDKLDQQQSEIEKLKKDAEETKARLEKLEKLLEK